MLFVLGDEHYLWYQRVHHVVIDGYGTALADRQDLSSSTAPRATGRDSRRAGSARSPACWLTMRPTARRSGATPTGGSGSRAFEDRPDVAGLAPGIADHVANATCASAPIWIRRPRRRCRQSPTRANVAWPDVLVALAAAYVGRHTDRADVVRRCGDDEPARHAGGPCAGDGDERAAGARSRRRRRSARCLARRRGESAAPGAPARRLSQRAASPRPRSARRRAAALWTARQRPAVRRAARDLPA